MQPLPGERSHGGAGERRAWRGRRRAASAQTNPRRRREPRGSSRSSGDAVVAAAPAPLRWQRGGSARGGAGLSRPLRRRVRRFYYPYHFLTLDRLKSAAAIFRRVISINSGSRLLAAKIDETTAGASERDEGSGRAAARGAHTPQLSAADLTAGAPRTPELCSPSGVRALPGAPPAAPPSARASAQGRGVLAACRRLTALLHPLSPQRQLHVPHGSGCLINCCTTASGPSPHRPSRQPSV